MDTARVATTGVSIGVEELDTSALRISVSIQIVRCIRRSAKKCARQAKSAPLDLPHFELAMDVAMAMCREKVLADSFADKIELTLKIVHELMHEVVLELGQFTHGVRPHVARPRQPGRRGQSGSYGPFSKSYVRGGRCRRTVAAFMQ